MSTFKPLPPDAGGEEAFEGDRAHDRVAEVTETELEDVPETEGIDEADAESRLDLDPEEQKNATDPAFDADEDTAG